MDKKKTLEEITKVVRKCGDDMLNRRTSDLNISTKTSSKDIVTDVDLYNQNKIINSITNILPEAGFLSEEFPDGTFPENELVFIIDPVDGTMNYSKDMGHSCISVACFKDKKPYIGIVYDPYRDEMFTAILGEGAFLNGTPIKTTNQPLSNSLVLTNTASYYPELLEESIERIHSILPKCIDIRIEGSAALDICYVAAGRAGLYFESRISLWDYAAGALILSEAGGELYKLDGAPITYGTEKTSIIAGPSTTIRQSGLLPS